MPYAPFRFLVAAIALTLQGGVVNAAVPNLFVGNQIVYFVHYPIAISLVMWAAMLLYPRTRRAVRFPFLIAVACIAVPLLAIFGGKVSNAGLAIAFVVFVYSPPLVLLATVVSLAIALAKRREPL